MMPRPAGFDWDDGNREKCRKHGVSIDEIEALLLGNPRVAPDLAHSDLEQRRRTAAGRALFVAFTLRELDGYILVRPVSARYMHKKESAAYEKKGA